MRSQSHRSFLRPGLALLPAAGVAALLLVLGAMVTAQLAGRPIGGPVYSVAAVRAHLARDPAAWVDRPLRVRAIAGACLAWLGAAHGGPCENWLPALSDPGAADGTDALPLALGPVPRPVAFLRRLPLLGQLAPASQRPAWGRLAVYRIEVRALSNGTVPPYYEALLLDPAPDALKVG